MFIYELLFSILYLIVIGLHLACGGIFARSEIVGVVLGFIWYLQCYKIKRGVLFCDNVEHCLCASDNDLLVIKIFVKI